MIKILTTYLFDKVLNLIMDCYLNEYINIVIKKFQFFINNIISKK
jgi:hypothetical protein